jgi:hypothetical protein
MALRFFKPAPANEMKELEAEILPPEKSRASLSQPVAEQKESLPLEEAAKGIAAKAGSILGGAVAGFTSGVAKHTVTPIVRGAAPIATGVANTTRGVFGFVRSVIIAIVVLAFAVFGFFAIVILSGPRR